MVTLPRISIRNPVFAWMLMAALIIFGAISFNRMGISQLPDVDFPIISVSATLDGAAPEVMETTVVDVLEGQLTSIEGVKSITSTARNGSANISLEFDINRNIDLALQDVQAKVAQAQRRLPRELDPPTVSKTNPEDQPILWMGVTSETLSKRELMVYVRDNIRDQFTTLPGVGDIFLGGYVEPAMRVWVDPAKLSRYALTVNDVIKTIQSEHGEPPAGRLEQGAQELNVRTMGEATNAREFENLRINTRGGGPNFLPIRLGDVVRIEEGLDDVRRLSRVGGVSSVGIGVRKQRGANAVAVADAAKVRMEELKKTLPPELKIQVVFDNTVYIREAVHELNFTLIVAAILTGFACWLFLGSFSSTLNILLAIPTSIVGTFIILSFSGFTLNTFTLLALSLAIGIVVDDAIMVLENITRHREMGKHRVKAALDGANEIFFAAVAASVSIVAIFLPVAFMKGIIGKYFLQFGVTMTAAVMLSLLEAITLTPMRASLMAREAARTTRFGRGFENFMDNLRDGYSRLLVFTLNHRWKVLAGSLVFFAGSLLISRGLNREFLPAEDQSRFMVRALAPVGSSLEYTNQKILKIEEVLKSIPEVTTYFVAVGGFGGGEVNTGMMFISLKPKSDRKRGQAELMNEVRQKTRAIQGVRTFVQDLGMRGFSTGRGYPVEFSIKGTDWAVLEKSTQDIIARMEKSGLMTDVDTDYQVGMPEVQIIPDRQRAAARGVTIQSVGETVSALLAGNRAGYYSTGGHRYEVIVKLEEKDQDYRRRIDRVSIRNNRGELIPLRELVTIRDTKTLQQITRRDRTRAVSIYANVKSGDSQQKALEVAEAITREVLPNGYSFVQTGSSQTFRESFESLIFALALGIIVAYMILGSQFNSFIDPVTVLLALPFSVSGAFIGLKLAGQSLNLYSMIGLILLMGIVKKNSILLVDFTNQARDSGAKNVQEALLKACPTRLRPIIMTSFATVVGALPAAIAFGPGAESRAPMAISVIGGVTVSTVLTLFVVPCFYSLFARKRRVVLETDFPAHSKHPASGGSSGQ